MIVAMVHAVVTLDLWGHCVNLGHIEGTVSTIVPNMVIALFWTLCLIHTLWNAIATSVGMALTARFHPVINNALEMVLVITMVLAHVILAGPELIAQFRHAPTIVTRR